MGIYMYLILVMTEFRYSNILSSYFLLHIPVAICVSTVMTMSLYFPMHSGHALLVNAMSCYIQCVYCECMP